MISHNKKKKEKKTKPRSPLCEELTEGPAIWGWARPDSWFNYLEIWSCFSPGATVLLPLCFPLLFPNLTL